MEGQFETPPKVTSERKKELLLFEKLSGIRFRKLEFLNLAFSHRSYANEQLEEIDNNEKLEFLGDSVLGLVISEYLYTELQDMVEGDFARIKSFVVSEDSLAEVAKRIKVDNYILIGKGEEYSGGRNKKAILADCMEAIIGAYYIDSGYKPVKTFILNYLVPEINKVLENKHKKDYKTLLQEFVQKNFKTYPKYSVVKRTGPDHNKIFWVNVVIHGKEYGPGKGKNKKEAEQEAAGLAYQILQK
ncbi:MAG: ribonuclease III [Spirochaetia bacterium]|nr:ribonuclease III [Spirochaetia bacterium]MCF7946535.1 ribonuclease III [Spirochaetia bacterium]